MIVWLGVWSGGGDKGGIADYAFEFCLICKSHQTDYSPGLLGFPGIGLLRSAWIRIGNSLAGREIDIV